jgi:hypothetical protein
MKKKSVTKTKQKLKKRVVKTKKNKQKKASVKSKVSTKSKANEISNELVVKRAKHDRVKALEGSVTKAEVSQFVLNEIIGKLASEVKKRGRNKNLIKFKKVRAAFDSFN